MNIRLNIALKKILCILAAVLVLFSSIKLNTCVFAADEVSSCDILDGLCSYLDTDKEHLLEKTDMLVPGDAISDWVAFSYGRMGYGDYGHRYLAEISDYVSKSYQENGGLDRIMATTWHRTALAVLSLGGDPTRIGKDKDGNPINLIKDGCYDFIACDSFDIQGLNAWIYALITMDSAAYPDVEGAKYDRRTMIEHILWNQTENGAFGLLKGGEDVDITAMALQALAPYYRLKDSYALEDGRLISVFESIDKALLWLSENQTESGGFMSYEEENSESCAQVIMALCSLGIDPESDERFIKNNNSLIDALFSFKTEDNMFSHVLGDGANVMATEQALRAMQAYERLRDNKPGLYDLSDRKVLDEETLNNLYKTGKGFNALIIVIPAAVAVAAIIAVVLLRKKRK